MPDKLSTDIQEQAILYLMNEMDGTTMLRFERQIEQSTELQTYIEEIRSTLSFTESLSTITPTEEMLQGQRNILRSQIASINEEQSSWTVWLSHRISEITRTLDHFRQPVWATVTYVALAFFIGNYFSTNTSDAEKIPSPTNYTTIQELIQSGAIQTADINIGQNDTPVEFAIQASNEVNVSGNVEDQLVRDLLFYLLLNDKNPGNRLKAVKLMEQIEPVDETMMVILSSALSDPNPGVRLKSVRLLHQFEPNPTLIDACLKILLEEKNEAIRMEALSILSTSPSPEIASTLRVIRLVDENDFIREQTARVLADMNDLYPPQRIESIQEN